METNNTYQTSKTPAQGETKNSRLLKYKIKTIINNKEHDQTMFLEQKFNSIKKFKITDK